MNDQTPSTRFMLQTVLLSVVGAAVITTAGIFLWGYFQPTPPSAPPSQPQSQPTLGELIAAILKVSEREKSNDVNYYNMIDARMKDLQGDLKTINDKLKAPGADKQKLEDQLSTMQKDLLAFAKRFDAYQKSQQVHKSETPGPSSTAEPPPKAAPPEKAAKPNGGEPTAPSIPPEPPKPPISKPRLPEIDPEKPPGGGTPAELKAFALMVGAAICAAQPELCPLVAIFGSLFGGGDTVEQMKQLKTMTDLAAGRPVTDEQIESFLSYLASKVSEKDIRDFKNAMDQLRQNSPNSETVKQYDRAVAKVTQNDFVLKVLAAVNGSNADCNTVKAALSKLGAEPVFDTPRQKNAVKIALGLAAKEGSFGKFWDQCLKTVKVQGTEASANP